MKSVNELYGYLNEAIPSELSCDWDNDGRMCIPSPDKQVKKVLVSLDANDDVIDYAAENGFDCIITHHPMIFHPLKNVDFDQPSGRKLYKLIKNEIAVMSFHTRLDAVSGGVNDALADAIGLKNIEAFSDVGRMGNTERGDLTEFAEDVKSKLGASAVVCVDGRCSVNKVAVVGGSGKSYIFEAVSLGCDTLLTGEVSYDAEQTAREMGINLVCGGHYFTENLVCDRLELLIKSFDEGIYVEKIESNPSFVI